MYTIFFNYIYLIAGQENMHDLKLGRSILFILLYRTIQFKYLKRDQDPMINFKPQTKK